MHGRSKTIVVAITLLLSLAARTALAEDTYEGKIAEAAGTKLLVLSRSGETVEFAISGDCKITRNGKKASVDDLVVGDSVKVEASRSGESLTAKSIDAVAAE